MSEKTEDIYRHKNRIDLQALLAALTKLDTVPGITQAITNPLSPLCQKLMKLLMDNAELEAAEICFAIIEYQQEIIAEAEQHEKAIRAKLEARELSEAKKHALEMQAMSADKTTASQALSPAELQERCTDFNALIEALRQNLKTVNSTLRNLSESVDESNRKWTEAEPEKAKAAVDYLIAVKGPTLQVEMQTNEQTEIVSINLERKREQLEQALIIPPPAKLLAMNSMLQENMTKEPEKTIVYFDLLRDIRILGALSTDETGHCNPRLMLALAKQQKVQCTHDEDEKAKMLAINDLITAKKEAAEEALVITANTLMQERKNKEALLARLKTDLNKATSKFNSFESQLLDHPSHRNGPAVGA